VLPASLLQSGLCEAQALFWHAVLQYAATPHPAHRFSSSEDRPQAEHAI
jgi:hypothetical protein